MFRKLFRVRVPLQSKYVAGVYFIGSGDDYWVPQTSVIVPLRPPVWLHFGCIAQRPFCGPRQELVELGGSLAPHPRQNMAVGVQGERDLRLPKALLDNLGM